MTKAKFTVADYPLADTMPNSIYGKRGIALGDITLEAVVADQIEMIDLQITPQMLNAQAEVAADAGRKTLAQNFNRASELVNVPQSLIMSTYELLRPGRAKNKQELIDRAVHLRDTYDAVLIAGFIFEAAENYEKRGLFKYRF